MAVVHHHRIFFFQPRKTEAEEQHIVYFNNNSSSSSIKKTTKRANVHLIFLLCLFSFTLAFLLFSSSSNPSTLLHSFLLHEEQKNESLCPPSMPSNTILCDRAGFRTDLCFLKGDVRAHSSSSSIFLHSDSSSAASTSTADHVVIKPYPRKWEASIMSTVRDLHLLRSSSSASSSGAAPACDVRHDAPAVVFSAGGYTGNVFHEFNEGIVPLYVTSRRLRRDVVFVVAQLRSWWATRYGDVLSRLSAHPLVDFSNDARTHCFPEALVGLRIDGDLSVDGTAGNVSVGDLRALLEEAYLPRIRSLERKEQAELEQNGSSTKPALTILSRNGSRAIENEAELVSLAEGVGFRVTVLRPDKTTELAKMYRALNASDAMVGVHGAAMTHFLFMRPGSVFVQIVPLGTDWAAETYYGGPARRMGLRYSAYRIGCNESSLSREYGEEHPVLRDPRSVNAGGWEVTKKVYLDGQSVRLDLGRFRKRLEWAYAYLLSTEKLFSESDSS